MNKEEKLVAKLMAARAVKEDADKAVTQAWAVFSPMTFKAGEKPGDEYEAAHMAWSKAREAYAKAKKYHTRIENELKRVQTGIDPRAKVYQYSATMPDGYVATRKSPRTYTHAIACPTKDGKGWWVEGWAGSERLAANRVRRLHGLGYTSAMAVKADIK